MASSKTEDQLLTELHFTKVDLEHLKSVCVTIRRLDHTRELFLELDEVLECIKRSEFSPEGAKVLELDEAVKQWDHWQIPPDNNGKMSIQDLFNRASPSNKDTSFLQWCKDNNVVAKIYPGDFNWNPSYRGQDKESIYEKICQNEILNRLLVNNYNLAS